MDENLAISLCMFLKLTCITDYMPVKSITMHIMKPVNLSPLIITVYTVNGTEFKLLVVYTVAPLFHGQKYFCCYVLDLPKIKMK